MSEKGRTRQFGASDPATAALGGKRLQLPPVPYRGFGNVPIRFQASMRRLRTFASRPELADSEIAALECPAVTSRRSFWETVGGMKCRLRIFGRRYPHPRACGTKGVSVPKRLSCDGFG